MLRSDVVSVIGGGPSARNVDLTKLEGAVIGVNDSGILAPHVDIILSMDRKWMENRWRDVVRLAKKTFFRRSAMHNIPLGPEWLMPFDCCHVTAEFGESLRTLNGPNSGHCALNLAYVMRPKRIDLVGFDMGEDVFGRAYWYKPYAWTKKRTGVGRYAEWGAALKRGIEQCNAAGIEVRRIA